MSGVYRNESKNLLSSVTEDSSGEKKHINGHGDHNYDAIKADGLGYMNGSTSDMSSEYSRNNCCCASAGEGSHKTTSLIILCIATLTASFAISLFPPFYPKIAEDKGSSASVYGFVLGSNCLTVFLVTPYIGSKLNVIGLKFAFVWGMFANGAICALAGYLDRMPAGWVFVTMSIAIRVLSAISNAAVITSSFAYISIDFPKSIAKIFSLTRIMMNVGQLAGPALGGAIYEIDGYYLPFVSLGLLQCVVAVISHCAMPNYDDQISSPKKMGAVDRRITVTKMLKMPGMWVAFSVFLVSTICSGFISVTLEPCVLRQFELTPFYMGLLFGVKDGANSIFSPFWGWVCDKKGAVRPGIIACCALASLSFILIGPMPGLNIPVTIGLVIFAMTLNGIALGGQQVAGVVDALNEAIDCGYPDDPSTHGCVSGMWSSVSGLGRFLARSISGVLIDDIGFRMSTLVVVGVQALVAGLTLFFMVGHRRVQPSYERDGAKQELFAAEERKASMSIATQPGYTSIGDTTESNYPKLMQSKEFHLSQSISHFL